MTWFDIALRHGQGFVYLAVAAATTVFKDQSGWVLWLQLGAIYLLLAYTPVVGATKIIQGFGQLRRQQHNGRGDPP